MTKTKDHLSMPSETIPNLTQQALKEEHQSVVRNAIHVSSTGGLEILYDWFVVKISWNEDSKRLEGEWKRSLEELNGYKKEKMLPKRKLVMGAMTGSLMDLEKCGSRLNSENRLPKEIKKKLVLCSLQMTTSDGTITVMFLKNIRYVYLEPRFRVKKVTLRYSRTEIYEWEPSFP